MKNKIAVLILCFCTILGPLKMLEKPVPDITLPGLEYVIKEARCID